MERTPTVFALYHEARHHYHGRQTSLGGVVVTFASAEQARNYAYCQGLSGYLPAALTAQTVLERYVEFERQDLHGFLLDLCLDGHYALLQGWGERDAKRLERQLRLALKKAVRVQRAAMRKARRRERPHAGRPEYHQAMEAYRRYRFAEAVRFFEQSIAADPKQTGRACVELGDIYRLQRRFPEARASYERALAHFGDGRPVGAARALAGMGHCYFNAGKPERAIEAFEEAFAMSREQASIGLTLVRMLVQQGRYEQAGKRLRELQDEHPSDPDVLDEVASWLTQAESYAAAHLLRRKIARLRPEDTENLLKLAELCAPLGNVQDGFDAFSRVMARTPEAHIVLRFHLFCLRCGVKALHVGHAADAARCLRTLTRAHSNWRTAQLGLALALEMLCDAQNVAIDEDGVGPAAAGDVEREAVEARSRAEALGASPAATVYDVTVDALLSDLRRLIHEADLAAELEHLLFEDPSANGGSGGGEKDDDNPAGFADEEPA